VAVFAVAGLLVGGTLWEQVQPYFARETLPGDDLVSPPLDEGSPLPIEGGDQFAKASRLLDEGQPGQARDVFKRALEENPGRWEDFMQIVYDVYGMGNTPLTIDLLEAGFSVAGKYDLPSREWLGWLYLDENRVEDAKNLFREMVKEHPTWGGAYEGMIASYSHTNDEQAAIDFLKTMADQFPDEPNVPYALGALYLNLEDYPQAKNYFGKVIQMAPGDPRGYMQMAGVYVGLGDNRNAEDAIQQALRLAPDDGAFLDSAAWWYYDMGKYDIAIENFQKAIENGYDEAWTYLGLAQSLFEFGGAENQIRDALKKAEEKAEKDALLLAQIGWAYVDLGDCPRAVDLFHTALDIAPSLFEAQDGLDKCRE
jgi:tetratricopeptide (TPR) repeat protein